MNIDEIRIVEREMVRLLPIFLREMIDYVSVDKKRYIEDRIRMNRANQLIGFGNGMGAWCDGEKIYFSLQNKEVFERLAKSQDYGKRKDIKLVSDANFIDNDKDYIDYMEYLIGHGLTELDYCLDVLPHEIMHLIGCKGGVLGEGITELRTRQICKKYGIRCAPILHSKETKLIRKLEKYVGAMMIDESGFWGDYEMLENAIGEKFGKENFRPIYEDLCIAYRCYASDRTRDPIVHYQKYRDIDFEPIYRLIESQREVEVE